MKRLFKKETAIQSVKILFAFQILLIGIGFVRGVLFARLLGPAQYGVFTLALMLVSLVSPFVILGISSSLSRYIPKYEQKEMLTDFLKRVQYFPIISSFFFSAICIIYATQISQLIFNTTEYNILVMIVAITIVPATIYRLIWSILGGLKNFLVRSLLELSYGVLLFGFGLFFILKHPLAKSLITGNLCAYLVVVVAFGLLLIKYVFRRKGQENKLDKTNLGLYKEVISFGFWMILANLAFTALHYIDKWMLNRYVGATEVGVYTVAMTLTAFLFLGIQLIGSVLNVNLNYLWEQGKKEKIDFILNAIAKFSILAFLAAALIIQIIKEPLIRLLYTEQYLNAINVIPYLLLMQTFMVCYWLRGPYASLTEKTYISFIAIGVGLFANIGLNFWLIPLYQMKGAAIATACSSLLLFLVQNLLYKINKIKIHKPIFLLAAMGLILLIPKLWISVILLFAISYIFIRTNLLVSHLERDYIWKQIKKSIKKNIQ